MNYQSAKQSLHSLAYFLFFSFLTTTSFVESANTAFPKVTNGNLVCVWQSQDVNGTNVQALSGPADTGGVISAQNTWVYTTLASVDPLGPTAGFTFLNPTLYTNNNGDAVAVWESYDQNGLAWTAASILPVGTTTWYTTTISTATSYGNLNDAVASVDDNGNIIVTWTSYDGTYSTIQAAVGTVANAASPTNWTTYSANAIIIGY